MNGLVARSRAIVVGKVASPAARITSTCSIRSTSARLSGSTDNAKRPLASVYSWAQ